MSIKRLGKNRYLVRVVVARIAGRQKFHNKTIHGERSEAEAYEKEIISRRNKGLAVAPSSITLDAHIQRWLTSRRAKGNVRENSLETYQEFLGRYVQPLVGSVRLAQLNPLHIEVIIEELLAKNLSPNTVRNTLTILHACLRQAVRWGLLYANPVDAVELPSTTRPQSRAFDETEARAFLRALIDSPLRALFTFALYTGLRPEEYLGLAWSDLDLDACVVRVRRTLVWRRLSKGWYFGKPKSKKSEREVSFRPALVEILKEHKRYQAEVSMKARRFYRYDLELVFADGLGLPLRRQDISRKYLKPVVAAAEIEGRVTLYCLRHTYATLLLAGNEKPKTVSENMGHSRVAFTLDTYAHVLPTMREDSALLLEKILKS